MSERVIGPSFDPDGPGYELGRCSDPPGESCADAGCPVHGDLCPDCGRGDCEGEECYWPGEAGLRPR